MAEIPPHPPPEAEIALHPRLSPGFRSFLGGLEDSLRSGISGVVLSPFGVVSLVLVVAVDAYWF